MAERRPPGFNVDLGFYDSDEVLSIPRKIRAAAIGVWTLCGSYSANKLTDGYVSAEALRDRGCTPAIRAALIASTLWESADVGAIQSARADHVDAIWFTRWPKWQRTCGEVKAYREAEAERKRRSREARKGAATSDDSEMSARTASGRSSSVRADGGDPVVRPEDGDPKTKTETKTELKNSVVTLGSAPNPTRGTRLPDGWRPPDDVIAQMGSDHPNVNFALENAKFIDYWQSKAGKDARKADWTATWRNWIRRAAETTRPPINGNRVHVATSDLRVAQTQALKNRPEHRLEIEP